MSVAAPSARILRAIESLRNAQGSLNHVVNRALGPARSSAQEASGNIEQAQHELKMAFQELQRIANGDAAAKAEAEAA